MDRLPLMELMEQKGYEVELPIDQKGYEVELPMDQMGYEVELMDQKEYEVVDQAAI